MRFARGSLLLLTVLLAAAPAAAGLKLEGTVYTEDTAPAVTVRVYALGEPLVSGKASLDHPLAEKQTAPGSAYAFDLPGVTLPVTVEVSAPGHVAAGFDVIFPSQQALPPAWLPRGTGRVLRVVADGKPAVKALVWGSLATSAPADQQGRWVPCVPVSTTDAAGTVRFCARDTDSLGAVGLDAGGRWGSLRQHGLSTGLKDLVLDSRPVRVRVVDVRAKPVAGIRVAGETAPAGAAAVSGEDGRATVMVEGAGTWGIVALDASRLGRTVRSGGVPAGDVVLTVTPFDPVEVLWTAPPAALAVVPAWIPAALSGSAPLLAEGGRARLPFWGSQASLLVFAPGFQSDSASFAPVQRAVALHLRPEVRIEGAVVGADGQPAAGVPVWSRTLPFWMRNRGVSMSSMASRTRLSDLPAAVSSPAGAFSIAGLPSGPLAVEARRRGLPPAASPDLDAKPGSTHRVTLRLVPGQTLTLTTVDGGGVPLAGVLARVFRDTSAEPGGTMVVYATGFDDGVPPLGVAESDSEGRVSVPGLAAGGVRVELTRRGYARRWAKGVIGAEGLDLGEQPMEPGADVTGQVVDDGGTGVDGVDVFIDPLGMGRTSSPATRTDAQGFFVIADQARTGQLQLSAQGKDAGTTSPVRVELPPDGPVTIRVHRKRSVEGRVVDRDTGEAVSGATVHARKNMQRRVGGRMQFSAMRVLASAESDDDGRFRLDGLEPGEVELDVTKPAYRDRTVPVEIPAGADPEPLTVPVERGLTIRGRVVDTSGAPGGGVLVTATAARADRGPLAISMSSRSEGATSSPDGSFEILGLAPGRYEVSAKGEQGERGREVAEAGADGVVLRLERPGTLRGTVRGSDGGVPERCKVQALGDSGVEETDAGPSGAFAIEGLAPGSYRVFARAPGYSPASQNTAVEAGGTATVDLELAPGGTIRGRVSGLSPDELQRCRVFGAGGATQPSADGTFTLTGASLGRDRITASVFPGGRQRSATVEVTDVNTPAEVEIDFGGGLTLSGSVTRAGRPAAGLGVGARTTGAGPGSTTITDEAGHFSIGGLEPGEADVTVQDEQGRPLVDRHVTLTADTEVDLEVPAGVLSGHVVAAGDGTPVMEARIDAVLQGSTAFSRQATSDDAGAFELRDLPDGTYTLRASAPGYSPAEATAALSMGAGSEVRLELGDENLLELVVREADGRAPDRVYLLPMRGGRVEDSIWAPVDGQGRARVGTLPPGDTTLLVTGMGAALVRVMVPSRGNGVQLQPPGRLIVVTPLAEGAPPARVRVATAAGLIVPVSPWLSPTRDGWTEAAAGRTTMSLPPGAYVVEMTGPDGEHRTQPAAVTPGGTATVTFE